MSTFNFPNISSDQVFQFSVTVDDGENFISDTLLVTYLNNTAPLANAGDDFSTCDASFVLSARKSYDVDWNSLSYSWSVLDGSLNIDGANTKELTVVSPVDLDQDTDYSLELIVTESIAGQDHCSDRDTITVTIEKNICPIADAGKDRRIPKFENSEVTLNAGSSYDPEGDDLIFLADAKWISGK